MDVLVLSDVSDPTDTLPTLALLPHVVTAGPPELAAATAGHRPEVVIVDARTDLVGARTLCRLIAVADPELPVLPVVLEGGLVVIGPDWGVSGFVLASAGPAEVEARLRFAVAASAAAENAADAEHGSGVVLGDLTIDEETYVARLRGRALDLTYKEFELLKFLARHPGRVFTRAQLLHEVWGYDFFGGTRTVDVHVRRLRAKLGGEYEAMIGTVRNVGYKVVEQGVEGDG